MYITCMVIDHKQNVTIHLSIENQTYPNRQKNRKRTRRVKLCRRISKLSTQAKPWGKKGDGSNYVGEHQTYLNWENVEKKRNQIMNI